MVYCLNLCKNKTKLNLINKEIRISVKLRIKCVYKKFTIYIYNMNLIYKNKSMKAVKI